ncbi:MAG: hypothetical protein WC678_01305 [Parcubacteria group bacterium]|jgi:hypothetical protein
MKKLFMLMGIMASLLFIRTVNAEMTSFSDVGLYSAYVSGRKGNVNYDNAVIQGDCGVNFSSVSTGLWFSKGLDKFNHNCGDEIDSFLIKKYHYQDFRFKISLAYFLIYNLEKSKDDVLSWEIDGSYEKKLFPYVNLSAEYPVNGTDGAIMWRVGICPKFFNEKLGVDFSLAGHDGAYNHNAYLLASGKTRIFWTCKFPKFLMTPEINFQKVLSNDKVAQNKIWGGINFSR